MCSPPSPQWPRPRPMPTSPGLRSTGRPGRPASWWPRSRSRRMRGGSPFQRRFVRFDDERRLVWAQLTEGCLRAGEVGAAGPGPPPRPSERHDPDYVPLREPLRRRPLRDLRRAGCAEPAGGRSPSTVADQTTMIVHTDLDRLLYGDGYGHASIQGVGPISAEVARRLACNADITLSFDASDGSCLDQKKLTARPERRAADRDPASGQRLPLPGLRLPQRDRRPSHRVGIASRARPSCRTFSPFAWRTTAGCMSSGWKMDGDAQGGSLHQPTR